jgi:tRNA(adenine34) deaminase
MKAALEEARLAISHGDVPIGALILDGNAVIASRHNERELRNDPTAHAELLALRDAANAAGSWRLDQMDLVVTLEPCPMCAGALISARIRHLFYGASDPKAGACGSLYNLCADPRLNHQTAVTAAVLADRAGSLLKDFFAMRRRRT